MGLAGLVEGRVRDKLMQTGAGKIVPRSGCWMAVRREQRIPHCPLMGLKGDTGRQAPRQCGRPFKATPETAPTTPFGPKGPSAPLPYVRGENRRRFRCVTYTQKPVGSACVRPSDRRIRPTMARTMNQMAVASMIRKPRPRTQMVKMPTIQPASPYQKVRI